LVTCGLGGVLILHIPRTGANKSSVDNSSSGECFVGVDLEQGTLRRKGFMLPKHKTAILGYHPHTGVIFDGHEVPFFHEAVMIARRAVEMIPVSVVGQDVTISHDGPVIIEGNADYVQASSLRHLIRDE